MPARIAIWTPAARHAHTGNRVTALRIAALLRRFGRAVRVRGPGEAIDARADVLIALHAHKCAEVAARWCSERGAAPLVVVLTGTDVYGDALEPVTLAAATRVVALQERALLALPPPLRAKARVILQSARPYPTASTPRGSKLFAVQLAHLRAVKDPLLAARALRRLPSRSRWELFHFGDALDAALAEEARRETAANRRYHWRSGVRRAQALMLLRQAHAFVQTSTAEGGSNAVAEAIVSGVPILATRIEGAVGQLGADHPGLFDVGDEAGLADLLERLDRSDILDELLRRRSAELAPRFAPEREAAAWLALLAEFGC
ncbi:MAG: glycosyltransferase [Planctomycetota bacterium]|nr:MAG: glycosyltransferase [Planctomycetota bacterium]